MNPKDYRYTKEHEWILVETANQAKIGLTDYAQKEMGDIVFLELPPIGAEIKQFDKMGEIESVKAVSDIYAPASGCIAEVNENARDDAKIINEDPYGAGWLVKIELSNPHELEALMTWEEYDRLMEQLVEEPESER